MNVIDELVEIFRKFPGVGPRQAERFVYYLLRQKKDYLNKLVRLIPELDNKVKNCELCKRFYLSENPANHVCNICSNQNRDPELLMVVGLDVDLQSIEKSGNFRGIYFVLGGLVPILEKEPETKIRLKELKKIVEKRYATKEIKEIILALNANPEGENTTDVVKKELKDFCEKNSIKVSILGRGLSTGTELEYSDSETIKNALKNRF